MIYLKLIVLLIYTSFVSWTTWQVAENKRISADNDRLHNQLTTQKNQDKITSYIELDNQEGEAEIDKFFESRDIFRYGEVDSLRTVTQDARCVVPVSFVSMWNSANRAQLPDPASVADDSPSGVRLSDIAAQKDRESRICIKNTKSLKSLQKWVREQQTLGE